MKIRILEPDPNKRGDLFGRLMVDVLLALGYDKARLNVPLTAREVDIVATHRTERRLAVAECKATKEPIGGDALNKFAGALERERQRAPGSVVQGYFISLGGFRASALAQESESSEPRFVTLDGDMVAHELVVGRILVSRERAVGAASGLAGPVDGLTVHPEVELLGHERGWVWCVYFEREMQRSHYALVHASGNVLGGRLASEIVAGDDAVADDLAGLVRLEPVESSAASARLDRDAARSQYYQYLVREFGSITLEGLPADQEVGARRIRLENLYVPLHLTVSTPVPEATAQSSDPLEQRVQLLDDDSSQSPFSGAQRGLREPVSSVLRKISRLAILASPGGGKSTLVKRLAVAYAFPDRRALGRDELPERPWLPLVVRCRQLESVATTPVREILTSIVDRAEMPSLREHFDTLISDALVSGEVLLLVDGLDEIADDSDRVGFVMQLRTFLATYPTVSLIVTSREAGFRVVGNALAHVCAHYRVSDLDDADVEALTVAWHREVVGDAQSTLDDARRLAARIVKSDRVRRLAANPLLLTTLLLVNRWVGDLPRKRSVLYGKAIEVLLMTWNVEGHRPIDQEESLPQLAYVAFAMSSEGAQTVSGPRLRGLLREARAELPAVLGYAGIPVSEFVSRIEDRSSVLSLTGHDIVDGRITSIYEFKHLTFQEYLTALAVAERNLPSDLAQQSIVELLEPHILKAAWREIIPLVAVLAGRHAGSLVQRLIDMTVEQTKSNVRTSTVEIGGERQDTVTQTPELLARCLADEAQLAPVIAERACDTLGRLVQGSVADETVRDLLAGRYGATFSRTVKAGLFAPDFEHYIDSALTLAVVEAGVPITSTERLQPLVLSSVWETVDGWFKQTDQQLQAMAALAAAALASSPDDASRTFRLGMGGGSDPRVIRRLIRLLESDSPTLAACACLGLGCYARLDWIPPDEELVALRGAFSLWLRSGASEAGRLASYALAEIPLQRRRWRPLGPPRSEADEMIAANGDQLAALIAAYYLRSPWSDDEIRHKLDRVVNVPRGNRNLPRLRLVLRGGY